LPTGPRGLITISDAELYQIGRVRSQGLFFLLINTEFWCTCFMKIQIKFQNPACMFANSDLKIKIQSFATV